MHIYYKVLQHIIGNPKKCFIRRKTSLLSYSHFFKDLPKTQCTQLGNGLTVATEERDCLNVCMGLYINAGSRHENKNTNGITHFFDHLVYKGTFQRTKTVLEEEMSNMAAKFKCFTNRDTSAFYVHCLASELPNAMEILFYSIFNNAFTDAEIELQKQVVYQEMVEHDRSMSKLLFDYLHSTAFQGTRLSQTVMGPSKNLQNFKSSSICNHILSSFLPQRTAMIAVGGVKHELVTHFAEQHFGVHRGPKCVVPLGPSRYTGSQVVYRDDSMNVAHVAIAVEGPSYDSDDKLAMDVASSVIGGWDASQPGGTNHGVRLAQIASAGSLCQSYKAFSFYYQDTGLWGVEYIAPRLEVDDMILTVQEEWMRLCHMVTDGELLRAKNEMKSKIIMTILGTTSAFHDLGQNILRFGCQPDLLDRLQAIDDITAKDIRNVCDKYIYDQCPVVVGLGATECLFNYTRIRSYMYWLRV